MLETVLQDLRYAIRALRRTPLFAATAIAALALGIGANTAVFSVINAVLLKPLTYPDADRIVLFHGFSPAGPNYGASATKFNVWRQQTDVFGDIAAYEYNGADYNLTGGDYPEQVRAIRISANYFRLLGAPVVLGRTFTPAEDQPNGSHVAVISSGLWQRRFANDPEIIGQTLPLSGTPYTVIGVIGPAFQTELDTAPDVWLPFQIDPNSTDHAHYFNVIARLKPGVTIEMADARLQGAAAEFRERFPDQMGPREGFQVQLFQDAIVSDVRLSLLVLLGAVGFVLLIACANVANLLLVRAAGRRREIALRAALGAGRTRIVRQLLTESVVLAVIGGAFGLILGNAGIRLLLATNTGNIPRIGEYGARVATDSSVLVFTALVSVLTGIIFGLIPALQVSRTELSEALKKGGGRSGVGAGRNRTRSILVVTETALALVLLIGAGLLIRSFVELRSVDPGFDSHNVLTMRQSLAGSRFDTTAEVSRLVRDAVQRLESQPGIEQAAAGFSLPLEGAFGIPYNIVGRTPPEGRYDGRGWLGVSPGYFEVFKIPVLAGRLFNERDDQAASPVAIINQAMAHKFWPGESPIGERVILGKGYGPEFEEPEREIIGVIGDVHDFGLDGQPIPMVYVPMAQVTDGITALAGRASSLAWVARTRGEPHAAHTVMEREIIQATAGLPVARIRSMDEIRSQSTARASFNTSLLTAFGCAALLLAAIGIYGLMAYSVEQRRQEIGVRLALGATPTDVRDLVVGQGMRLALIGIAIGLAAALGLTQLLASFLFGVETRDPLVFFAVPVFLSGIALVAAWIPAQRAIRINPVSALRSE